MVTITKIAYNNNVFVLIKLTSNKNELNSFIEFLMTD